MHYFSMTAGLPTPRLVADGSEKPLDKDGVTPLLTAAEAAKATNRTEADLISQWKDTYPFVPAQMNQPAEPKAGEGKPWWETQPENMCEAVARQHIYPHLTDELFAIFKNEMVKRGVNLASRYIIPKVQANRETGEAELVLITTLTYMQIMAEQSGLMRGIQTAAYLDDKGEWHDGWPYDEMPKACRVGIKRQGYDEPVAPDVYWREIAWRQDRGSKPVNPESNLDAPPNFYEAMPLLMLQRCALAASYRAAFRHLFDGLYIGDEIRSDNNSRPRAEPKMHIAEFNDDDDQGDRANVLKMAHEQLNRLGFFKKENRQEIIDRFIRKHGDDLIDQNPDLFVEQVTKFGRMNRKAS